MPGTGLRIELGPGLATEFAFDSNSVPGAG